MHARSLKPAGGEGFGLMLDGTSELSRTAVTEPSPPRSPRTSSIGRCTSGWQ
jgi:hypothetical protein